MRARTAGIILTIIILLSAIGALLYLLQSTPSSAPPAPTAFITDTIDIPTETATPSPIASPTSEPTPIYLRYTVQEGDTLSAIALAYGVSLEEMIAINNLANPNALAIGQTLIIPIEITPTPTPPLVAETAMASPPTPTLPPPSPLPTPSTPPIVEIGQVIGAGVVGVEAVSICNRGGMANLEGWTLSDAEGNIFVFPALTLFDDAEVWVHSSWGRNTPLHLYWNRTEAAWASNEMITLRDRAGNIVDIYIAP